MNVQQKPGRRQPRASKSTSAEQGEPECIQCKAKITDEVKALECNTCNRKECIACAKISEALYNSKEVLEQDNILFVCTSCRTVKQKRRQGKDNSQDKLDTVLEKLQILDSVLESCSSLDKRLSDFEINLNKRIDKRVDDKMEEAIQTRIAKKVRKCLEEQKERERRSTNIVIYGAEEPEGDDASAKKENDIKTANELFTALGILDANIIKTVRLGEKKEDIKRPWKIILEDAKTQREIIRCA